MKKDYTDYNKEDLIKEIDKINEAFKELLPRENDLFEKSKEENSTLIYAFLEGFSKFTKLLKEISCDIHEMEKTHFEYIKRLLQTVYCSLLYALRGNIGSSARELRFAIETISIFAYLSEKKNLKILNLKKEEIDREKINHEQYLKKMKNLNIKTKNESYEYLGNNYPEENKKLIQLKEEINCFFAHSLALTLSNIDVRRKDNKEFSKFDLFDSDDLRNNFLTKHIKFSFSTMSVIYSILCTILEKESEDKEKKINANFYRNEMSKIISRLKKRFPNIIILS